MKPRLSAVLVMIAGAALGAASQQQPPTFVGRTAGVRLDVSVLDGPTAVHGLDAKNFEITDNRARQQFSVVETRDTPLDIVLVVQPLPSLTKERQGFVQAAMEAFRTLLRDDDRLGMVTASAGPDVVRPLAPVSQALARAAILSGADGVTVRDALLRAFLLFDGEDRRKAILAFTDGQHDQSWVTTAGVENAAMAQPAQVITAALDSSSSLGITASFVDPRNGLIQTDARAYGGDTALTVPPYLASLTKRTGGRVIDLRMGDAAARLTELMTYLRSQYVITYVPTNLSPGWHEVDVRLKGTKGVVVTRDGYWAGEARR